MKAESLRIAKVFSSGGDVQYILPYFQREYAWDKPNWQTLLNDVLGLYDIYQDDKPPEHFMGSLVVINAGTQSGTMPIFKLVDGQQRLTTISIALSALSSLIKSSPKDGNARLYNRIRRLVTNPEEEGLLYFKLLPTKKYGDQTAYLAVIREEDPLPQTESRIPLAFQFYREQFGSRLNLDGTNSDGLDPDRLYLVLVNALQVVFIDLNQEERPYEIFESLNAKGKALSQADLVRNYIAMKLPESRQPEVFEKYWSKIEDLLQEKRLVGRSYLGELTAFLRHYLALRAGALCSEEHVYARFRDRIEAEFSTPQAFEAEIATLKRFAEYYDRLLRPEHESDKEIRARLERLNVLEFSTGYPFLMAAYDALTQKQIECQDFLQGMNNLENYMVRRYLAGEPTNFLNKVFPNLWKDIDPANFGGSLAKTLLQRNYPADNRITQVLSGKRMYDRSFQTRSKTTMVLETINRHLSNRRNAGAYTILSGNATIEHIMPQTLTDAWEKEMGPNFEQVYNEKLNTLGNLTLVTADWNASLSNSAYHEKKLKLASHGLQLNADYFSRPINRWDEQAILDRVDYLTDLIFEIWPSLGEGPTAAYTPYLYPAKLIIQKQEFDVHSWRDVAYQTAEYVCCKKGWFEAANQRLPSYFRKKPFSHASRQLSNGWWLNVNLSSNSVRTLCHNLLSEIGLTDNDWRVEISAPVN